MVAVRSAHLNKAGEFDPQKWIASLGISSQQSCERLTETWAYCLRTTQGHPDAELLLWRGIEMVEILSMLNMDIETLQAALLFPLADADVVSEDVLRDSVGTSVVALIPHGLELFEAVLQLYSYAWDRDNKVDLQCSVTLTSVSEVSFTRTVRKNPDYPGETRIIRVAFA